MDFTLSNKECDIESYSFLIFADISNKIQSAGIYKIDKDETLTLEHYQIEGSGNDELINVYKIYSNTLESLLCWLLAWAGLAPLWDILNSSLQADLLILCKENELGDWNRCTRFARKNDPTNSGDPLFYQDLKNKYL